MGETRNTTDKLPITLAVITMNEAENLARCLRAADFCRELLVVDSGSTDGTLEVARSFGARVLHRAWSGYREQKNFASQQAAEPWVLCIDADEVVSPELRRSILEAFQDGPPDCEAFEINRHALYAGRLINHSGWYPQRRLFLYRKESAEWGGHEPHTTVQFKGTRKRRLRGDLYHYTYADIRQHLRKNITAAHDWAEDMHARGRQASLLAPVLRAPWSSFRSYVLQLGVLDGFYGLMIAAGAGFYTFMKYAMLREMNAERRRREPQPDPARQSSRV